MSFTIPFLGKKLEMTGTDSYLRLTNSETHTCAAVNSLIEIHSKVPDKDNIKLS